MNAADLKTLLTTKLVSRAAFFRQLLPPAPTPPAEPFADDPAADDLAFDTDTDNDQPAPQTPPLPGTGFPA